MASRIVATLAAAGVVLLGASGFVAASSAQQAQKQQEDDFLKGVYLKDAKGVTAPVLKHTVYPKYTSDAMRAKIQGSVEVQAVVMPDGTVGRARVTTSLDKTFGLDEQALIAAKQFTFVPGKVDGLPVPVAISLQLEFRLH
jgi:TonB family protein